MNGSGTTMLLDNLGHHPDLYAFPKETRLIPHLQATAGRFGDLQSDDNFLRLWKSVCELSVFRQVNGDMPVPVPDNWSDFPRSLAAVLDGVFGYFAGKEGKPRWCEKTPQHIQHMPLLADMFPGAKFIHVVRDGRDCAASFNRRWLRSPALTMFRWKKVTIKGRLSAKQLDEDAYMEVRYEDLTTEPEQWLRKVCEFIDLPYDVSVTQSSRPYLKKSAAKEEASGLVPNSGNWKNHFSAGQIQQLEEIGGAALTAFGYQAGRPDGDRNLSGPERKLLAARDAVMQYGREIGLKLTGKIDRSWGVILGKPLIAFRQRRQNKY